ncbi:hypothetical protein C2857_004709 [Epichloe festucae Fl1]|uniref:Uncharacterized protein n=1 Tax=Epichloe festucae (strain Fl1) TaxID=877507 RepID=A0A7S9KPJ0_EPIFF|nr:hypothetical protein C2857_004709 [Epichloe festucae Fl1]
MDMKTTTLEEGKGADAATSVSMPMTTAPVTTAEVAQPAEVAGEDVPDPDEDDLDDLDDMLEDFSTVKIEGSAQQSTQSASAAPAESTPKAADAATKDATAPDEPAFSEEDFTKQLQAGMADLLGELEKSPEMQEQFEDMFKHMAAAAGESGPGATGAESSSAKSDIPGKNDASFQETIRRTMERMQTSGEQATAAATAGSGEDFMSELLKQMGSGDLGGEGGEEEFSKMLMGMMEQLTNKEILYEPMKELDDKFPEWFEKNKASTPAEDLKRYGEQKALVREIVVKFEETSYSDSNAADREYIVDRMQKMQAAGSPPSDLVGDMASAQEAFGGADDQCNPQ